MTESTSKLSWRSALRAIGLISAAWCFGLVGEAILVAVTAPHKQSMEPITGPLLVLIGVVCLCLDTIGTYRLTGFIRSIPVRALATIILVMIQCCLFYLAFVLVFISVYIWAGGPI